MKLLLDQNLPHRIVEMLVSRFPDSTHVILVNLDTATDEQIWEYAKVNNYTIVSKDTDFYQRCMVFGHPPKVVWLSIGNCNTQEIEQVFIKNTDTIQDFIENSDASFLIVR